MEKVVLDKGFVRLDDSMADDLSVVNSARVSFAQKSELVPRDVKYDTRIDGSQIPYAAEWDLSNKDKGLINFLMKNRHGTPFEHNAFRFHVKAPLFIFREWQRHRWSSFNEWSARYSKLEPDFYIPNAENVRSQVGKPGNYTFEPLSDQIQLKNYLHQLKVHSRNSFERYESAIAAGIAKEQARLFLPVNIYSEMYWTVNARALMNFLSLRNDENAQWEIRQYAQVIEEIFAQAMPVTAKAFEDNGRVAP